ncbi:acyltransferase family protein [Ornithinimicrobium sufpigmenti]|uniref:acyltransferase family protein n=1 Tax=Ornithinimicrobium sufpigmenti TaxID=2508882 RepID=UPI0010357BCF|nr:MULTISPECIES: acyltransferase family protein [unclassified Ornithinimicrobium]
MTAPPAPRSHGRFRGDIEGMRAVAVLMVLLYHAGVPRAAGGFAGVDVFFVISGFLITGLLVGEARRQGRIDLVAFWGRRARRLLPASALVLATTAVLTVLVLPAVRWRETGWDILTSGLYVVNWRLAAQSVDYLAEDSAPSPVQHYWSLAVEEQFYLVWPVLVVVALLLCRRRPTRLGAALLVLLLAVVVPSFLWSLHLTETEPALAYLVTTTRLWQLGAGALLALAVSRLERLPGTLAALLSWAGLVAVLTGLLTQGAQGTASAWPGTAALVPTLGAAAMIAGGTAVTTPAWAATRLLSWAPLQVVGGLSYSLYLWHWPLLVVAAARWGELSVPSGLLVVAVSFVPAWLGHRYVEEPVRRSPRLARVPVRGLGVGLLCTVLAVASGGALVQAVDRQVRQAEQADGEAEGARALATESPTATAEPTQTPETPERPGTAGAPGPPVIPLDPDPATIIPDPLAATADVPALYDQDCDGETEGRVVRCDYGDPDGGLVVALVGDSKIAQWTDALDEVGRERGWRVHLYYRSACPWTAALIADEERAADCREWGEQVTGRLAGSERPDVVVVSAVAGQAHRPDGAGEATQEAMTAGLVERWEEVGVAGVPVVALADSPAPGGQQVYACVAEHRDDVGVCAVPPNDGSGTPPLRAAAEQVPTATFVTMNDWICPGDGDCPPVVGEVLVYRQGSHITNTYALSLADVLGDRLEHAFGRLGVRVPGTGLAGYGL